MLDEIKENEVPKAPKNKEKQHVPQTTVNVRRYTKIVEITTLGVIL